MKATFLTVSVALASLLVCSCASSPSADIVIHGGMLQEMVAGGLMDIHAPAPITAGAARRSGDSMLVDITNASTRTVQFQGRGVSSPSLWEATPHEDGTFHVEDPFICGLGGGSFTLGPGGRTRWLVQPKPGYRYATLLYAVDGPREIFLFWFYQDPRKPSFKENNPNKVLEATSL